MPLPEPKKILQPSLNDRIKSTPNISFEQRESTILNNNFEEDSGSSFHGDSLSKENSEFGQIPTNQEIVVKRRKLTEGEKKEIHTVRPTQPQEIRR